MPASSESITLSGDLHARPAGALAVAAGRFASAVFVTAGARTVDAKSVLGVMGLGATSGQQVTVAADGPDAEEAVGALIAILGEATRVGGLRPRPAGFRARRPPAGGGSRGVVSISITGFDIGQLTDVSRCNLQQYLSCNRQ